jgi:hypothetical protein
MSPPCIRACRVSIVAVAAALFLAACGGDDCGSAPTIATPSPPPTSTHTAIVAATTTPTPVDTATVQPTGTVVLTVHDELLPSADEMMGWIATVVEQGIRRPGYPADVWAEGWIRDQFASFGLEDITLDPVEVKRWTPQQCSLTVWPDAAPQDVRSIPCFALPYSQPEPGLETSVALMTPDADVAGKLALVDNNFIQLPQTVIRAFSSREYDPDGEFETGQHTLPFSFAFQNVMEPAIAAGAAGFIGIVNAPFDTHDYFVPYDAEERPLPGVWISASDGAQLKALLAAGAVSGRMVVEATLDDFTSHNVIATLPGASDEWIIIGSHHDGPWASAVEDGSGIAMVLAQARYWSRVPRHERPHNLRFLLNAGHMSGGAGLIAFVNRNADRLDEIVLEVHLEHAAREARGEEGRLIATDKPETRWWFTSRITVLEDAVEQALHAEDLRKSFIMQPDNFPPGSPAPPTDGAFFHPAGVPIVNFLTAPMYLFDAQDTLDKIHTPSLVPVTRAAIRIINAMQGRSAAELRAAVRPSPTPPGGAPLVARR